MASIIDERGYNQGFALTSAQRIRLERRAFAIVGEMELPRDEIKCATFQTLELGCGTGELAHILARVSGTAVTGVDLSAKFIDVAQRMHAHDRLRFLTADLSQISPESELSRYDYIVGNGILHHLYHSLDHFLPVMSRWLRPGGKLIFWEPNLMNPYVWLIFTFPVFRKMAKLEPEEMAFSSDFIRRKLTSSNFHDIKVATRDFLLPNTPNVLISPVISCGDVFERIPLVKNFSQSLFISARSPS